MTTGIVSVNSTCSCWLLAVAMVMISAGTLLRPQNLYNVSIHLGTKYRFSITSIIDIKAVLIKLWQKMTEVRDSLET